MPIAGEEGYEELVICPYDRSHEIRRGRMQFHLNKCRKNHPTDEMVQCAFNSVHIIPKMEEQFHTEEECGSRVTWDMHNYEVGDNTCPVKDLVDVNAATVPYGSENWDDFEAPGSVIETIKQAAAEKKIFRYLQCESKAKRRMFREEERLRHSELEAGGINTFQESPSTRPILGLHPLERSNTTPLFRQDHTEAVASVTKQFQNLSKPSTSESETSSACNKTPFALASAAPSTSFFPDPTSRPSSSMSSALSTSSRSSAKTPTPEDMFCQVPIPGLGRGRRRKLQQSSIN